MSDRGYMNRLVLHREDAPLVVKPLPPRNRRGLAEWLLYDENGKPILGDDGFQKWDHAHLIGGLSPRDGYTLYWGWLDDDWITLQWVTLRGTDGDEEGRAILHEATKDFKHDWKFSVGVNLSWRRPAKTMK